VPADRNVANAPCARQRAAHLRPRCPDVEAHEQAAPSRQTCQLIVKAQHAQVLVVRGGVLPSQLGPSLGAKRLLWWRFQLRGGWNGRGRGGGQGALIGINAGWRARAAAQRRTSPAPPTAPGGKSHSTSIGTGGSCSRLRCSSAAVCEGDAPCCPFWLAAAASSSLARREVCQACPARCRFAGLPACAGLRPLIERSPPALGCAVTSAP
jgi:hypothetical protein